MAMGAISTGTFNMASCLRPILYWRRIVPLNVDGVNGTSLTACLLVQYKGRQSSDVDG